MKILAFAASNSRNSINKKLVSFALENISGSEKVLLDLNDFPAPIYCIDIEKEHGIPQSILDFAGYIENADILLISLSEHNGSYSAVFKNLFDWLSRNKSKCFENKRLILLSTSTGARGGQGVMDAALLRFPKHGAEIIGYLCFPSFNENFSDENGIVNQALKAELFELLNQA